MANISDLFSSSLQSNPAPTSGTQGRIAQMNQQVLANASPVGRATEIARQSGQVSPAQAEAVKAADFNYRSGNSVAPPSPVVVSTSNDARNDINTKRTFADDFSQKLQAQKIANDTTAANQAAMETGAPPSAKDVASELAARYESPEDQTGGSALDTMAKTTKNTLELQQKAFDEYKGKMDQLQNGTIPLTGDQQAQLDATRASWDRTKQEQAVANANYTKGVRRLGILKGHNIYDPSQQLADVQASIDSGIAKIAKIETQANLELAGLKKGFREEDYTMINDQYSKLTGLLDKKQNAISDILKSVQEHEDKMRTFNQEAYQFERQQAEKEEQNKLAIERDQRDFEVAQTQRQFENKFNMGKFTYQQGQDAIDNALKNREITAKEANDLRDYNLKVQQLEQGNFVVASDAFGNPIVINKKDGKAQPLSTVDASGNPVSSSQNGEVFSERNSAYLDAFRNASLGLTDKDQKSRMGQLNQLLSQGKTKEAQELLVRIATKSAPADQQNQAIGRVKAIDSLNSIQTLLNAYVKKSGDTGIKKGTLEQIANKIGSTTDPELAYIGSQINQFLQNYRRDMTGMAFGEQENGEYNKIIPDITNIGTLNGAQINSLIDTMNRNQRSFLAYQIGESNYDKVFGGPTQVTDLDAWRTAHPEEWKNVEEMGRSNSWNEEETLSFLNHLMDKTSAKPDEPGFVGPTLSKDFNKPLSMGGKGSNPTGSLSAKFESSGDPGTIGYDSTGGWSYGKYQLAHSNAKSFVEQSPYASEFKGIAFNTPAFRAKWKEVAKEDPRGFEASQKEFVDQTHLGPQKQKLAKAGFNLNHSSPTLREVVFSTAIQHGPNNNIILNAVRKVGKNASEEDLIKEIYKERWSGGARFASSSADVKRGVYNRFFGKNGELATALKSLNA